MTTLVRGSIEVKICTRRSALFNHLFLGTIQILVTTGYVLPRSLLWDNNQKSQLYPLKPLFGTLEHFLHQYTISFVPYITDTGGSSGSVTNHMLCMPIISCSTASISSWDVSDYWCKGRLFSTWETKELMQSEQRIWVTKMNSLDIWQLHLYMRLLAPSQPYKLFVPTFPQFSFSKWLLCGRGNYKMLRGYNLSLLIWYQQLLVGTFCTYKMLMPAVLF